MDVDDIVGDFHLSKVRNDKSLMLSSRVSTNCLDDFMGYTSKTKVLFLTTIWAMLTPESTAAVSEKVVSVVATPSDLLGMLSWKSGLEMLADIWWTQLPM